MADMQCIPQKMRALQYDPSDQEAHIIEVDVPRPRDTELLYVIVDARSVAKLPPDIDVPSSGPLCCAGLTAYNAIKQCNLTLGDTVAIIGVGGVGQMAVQYAKAMRLKVIAVDTNGHQLDTAKILKADYTINPETCPKYANDIRKLTYGGVNAAINFTTSKKVYDDMPSMIKWGGIFMAVGAAEEPLNVDCKSLISRQHVIKAACNGTAKDLDECLHFSAKHKIKPVVEFRALEEIPAAIEMMRTGKLWNRVCVQF
ncbi:hypothetical protein H9Q70_000538 [Fusarium xylarioides]|nr:hypothetical protein H9Q70_000538 [Fusarium xylarioides]KAG5779564.1 hypothetical protein H9Q73_006787 [Fusarium xylarioides]KAG5819393.1 hypothetical protein H9Q71_001028 [Fusarium xylarioides]KAG5828800.1 hypothetical protein H9Q74_001146 [Fusarium xylarioides]